MTINVSVRDWATRKLRQGDLKALAAVASGAAHHDEERIRRLVRRGFVRSTRHGASVTARGWVALTIRRVMPF